MASPRGRTLDGAEWDRADGARDEGRGAGGAVYPGGESLAGPWAWKIPGSRPCRVTGGAGSRAGSPVEEQGQGSRPAAEAAAQGLQDVGRERSRRGRALSRPGPAGGAGGSASRLLQMQRPGAGRARPGSRQASRRRQGPGLLLRAVPAGSARPLVSSASGEVRRGWEESYPTQFYRRIFCQPSARFCMLFSIDSLQVERALAG